MKFAPALMMIFFNIFLPSLDACPMKLYVAPDAVALENNAIILKLEQGSVLVSSLHVDADGYYVNEEDVVSTSDSAAEVEAETVSIELN